MELLVRILVFLPVVFLVMVVYVAPHHAEPQPMLHDAARRSGKALMWTTVLILAMQAIQLLFLP